MMRYDVPFRGPVSYGSDVPILAPQPAPAATVEYVPPPAPTPVIQSSYVAPPIEYTYGGSAPYATFGGYSSYAPAPAAERLSWPGVTRSASPRVVTRSQTPPPMMSAHPAAYDSYAWGSPTAASPVLADSRDAFFDRLAQPVYRPFASADDYGFGYPAMYTEPRAPLHRSLAERQETVERLLRPKRVYLQPKDTNKYSTTPDAKKKDTSALVAADSGLYTPKEAMQIRDIYDESKRIAKKATALRDEPSPVQKYNKVFAKPMTSATSCLVGPNTSAVVEQPVEPTVVQRLPEEQRKLIHERLYNNALEQVGRDGHCKKAPFDETAMIQHVHLTEAQRKEALERLTKPIPPRCHRMPEDAKPKPISAKEKSDMLRRLTAKKEARQPPLPSGMRTVYPKRDEEQIEKSLERLTKQPQRYEEFAKRQQMLRQQQEGGNKTLGAGITRVTGAFMSS